MKAWPWITAGWLFIAAGLAGSVLGWFWVQDTCNATGITILFAGVYLANTRQTL